MTELARQTCVYVSACARKIGEVCHIPHGCCEVSVLCTRSEWEVFVRISGGANLFLMTDRRTTVLGSWYWSRCDKVQLLSGESEVLHRLFNPALATTSQSYPTGAWARSIETAARAWLAIILHFLICQLCSPIRYAV